MPDESRPRDAKRGRLLESIESRAGEQIDFLTSLCEVNSYTSNKEGTDRVAELVLERLRDVFPVREKVEQRTTGDHHVLRKGPEGKAVYLLGHLDTVFPPGYSFQACRTEGEWLYGPGAADMKGGLAVMVYALKALHETGLIDPLPLTMILGADEERGSSSSRAIYERERTNVRACLVAECGGENGEFVVSRNGKAGGRLDSFGRDRHVGADEEDKASAVLELAHQVIALESLNGLFPGVRVNAGRIRGGLGPATIPARASCLFDLRWLEEAHFVPLLERIKSNAGRSFQPHCRSEVKILNHRPAMPVSESAHPLIERLRKAGSELGQEVSTSHRFGSSDANFFGAAGVPTLDGFGPVGLEDHTAKERILIPSLGSRTALLALLLADLAGEAGRI